MKNFFYRVQSNENLLGIAERFNISVFELIRENELKKDVLEGDVIFISKGECDSYKVAPHDTFLSVSKKLNVSTQRLKKLNGDLPYLFYGLCLKY